MTWIGVDLDGTLAHYDGWRGPTHIGKPVPAMASRVRRWLAEGKEVRIFTARAVDAKPEDITRIQDWCEKYLGKRLKVTGCKDWGMVEFWDDRAVGVQTNKGIPKRSGG